MFQTENFDNHETRIIFLRARPLKKKKNIRIQQTLSLGYVPDE